MRPDHHKADTLYEIEEHIERIAEKKANTFQEAVDELTKGESP